MPVEKNRANTCTFSIKFEIKHEGGHYLKVKYDWIKIEEKPTFTINETVFLKDWNVLSIEGEEKLLDAEEQKASGKTIAKKPEVKKPAPGKG